MVKADEMCNACECSGMVPPPNVRTTESEMVTANLLLVAALTKQERENAKLRELTKEMFYSLLNVAGGRREMTAGEAQNLIDRMNVLGIEV